MSDRELLELAAKAAGYDFEWYCRGANNPNGIADVPCVDGSEWSPLTDDGDAFRLAIKLSMRVYQGEAYPWRNDSASYEFGSFCDEDECSDPVTATRIAIVRAAAEIGRAMP